MCDFNKPKLNKVFGNLENQAHILTQFQLKQCSLYAWKRTACSS